MLYSYNGAKAWNKVLLRRHNNSHEWSDRGTKIPLTPRDTRILLCPDPIFFPVVRKPKHAQPINHVKHKVRITRAKTNHNIISSHIISFTYIACFPLWLIEQYHQNFRVVKETRTASKHKTTQYSQRHNASISEYCLCNDATPLQLQSHYYFFYHGSIVISIAIILPI